MNMARRIAAILLLGPALDANYEAVKANTYRWQCASEAARDHLGGDGGLAVDAPRGRQHE